VHYAHSKVLESSWLAGGKKKKKSKSKSKREDDDVVRQVRAESDATLNPAVVISSSLSTSTSTMTTTTPLLEPNSIHSVESDSQHHSKIAANPLSSVMESTPDLVDIQVKVSDGRWSVCGQTLKWWYDVPSSSSGSSLGDSEKDGEDVKKYTIEIKRRDGPLRIDANNLNGSGGVGGRGWCREICEDGGCLIM
jgi:hypothetical protein